MAADGASALKKDKKDDAEQARKALALQIKAAKRRAKLLKARDNLLDFTQLTMPHPEDPDDVELSRYQVARHHEAIAAALEEVEAGNILRLIINIPPRHGKSELASRRFPAWFVGRDPYRQFIFATYNEDFARDFGVEVREILRSAVFRQVFPGVELRKGSQAADKLLTTRGGALFFVGRGGSITGRGADLALIDDPIKDAKEAQSKTIRDDLWKWFTDVLMTRLLNESARVVIIMTRWHEDDIVGRLTDPKNPHFDPEEAKNWHILNLAALAEENDPLGRPKGAPLWPERFGLTFLTNVRRVMKRSFYALYQGRPAPDDGDFFRREWLVGYKPHELPQHLRLYAASDHAVSTNQENDKTCMGCAGLDEAGVLWILPDIAWGRFEPDILLEHFLDQVERHRPLTWWAENEHILKSLGPFLRKGMQERNAYTVLEPSSAAKDIMTRAQAIRGRMSMKMVRFPTFAPWWGDAEEELLKFPNARHDDFVSFIAHLGRGVDRMAVSRPKIVHAPKQAKVGSIEWVKWAHNMEQRAKRLLRAGEGY